jgi:hypothetical protein
VTTWVRGKLECPGGTTIDQAIGTDGQLLYDISQQLNLYDDEAPVLQMSVALAPIGEPVAHWETVFYRNWQRMDVDELYRQAEGYLDLAIEDMAEFLRLYRGIDVSESGA